MKILEGFLIMLGIGILMTILFVRTRFSQESGGRQAARIIEAGTGGLADIIRAVQGA